LKREGQPSSALRASEFLMTTLNKIDLEKERYALIRRHIQDRKAHFEKDIATLLSGIADEQINLRDGRVITSSRADAKNRFTNYFGQVAEFLHWDDLQQPIIRISQDGTMAWMINRIRLHYRSVDNEEADMICAWLMVYEKQNDDWVAVANASTFSPPD
jgi:ketosteroid isomerase-like protein